MSLDFVRFGDDDARIVRQPEVIEQRGLAILAKSLLSVFWPVFLVAFLRRASR